jgi:hypothetical protein
MRISAAKKKEKKNSKKSNVIQGRLSEKQKLLVVLSSSDVFFGCFGCCQFAAITLQAVACMHRCEICLCFFAIIIIQL